MRRFRADILFDDFPCMYCEDFKDGYKTFKSWSEFIYLMHVAIKAETIPKYVFAATISDGYCCVDVSNIIEVPWDELEAFL